jgi:ANTAR domain
MALGAFATLTAEPVRTGVELVSRDLEMAQLRQALTSRIWIEQGKGVLAASQEVTPDERFQQLRERARSSSCKLADLVGEMLVQEAQRERVAALAMDDARVRAAKARAQAAEHALQAGPNRTDPTYRGPGPSPRHPGRTGAGRRPMRASRRPGRLAGGWRW